uniref:FBD domain-containing protein n=1 Tax=Ananas comosus var. bracteatus TaxID=296719 RepID=A0A6V7NY94_ANACO|nr:unnamed protein product [Ananas comosus var. bracteatus]
MNPNLPQSTLLQPFQSLSIPPTTASLDFGREFAAGKAPEEIVSIINRTLESYGSCKIKSFSLFFGPLDMFLSDVENWIEFAISQVVEELNLDFSMGWSDPPWNEEFNIEDYVMKLPTSLYSCESSTHLSLSHTDFCPLANFCGFDHPQFLSLRHMKITEGALPSILSKCPLLISLSLRDTHSTESIRVFSPELLLERLEIIRCGYTTEFRILAPKLKSFIFNSGLFFDDDSFADISSLEDAFVNSIEFEAWEPEDDYVKIISDLSHVKILTACMTTLRVLFLYLVLSIQIYFNNRRMPILMDLMSSYTLEVPYSFLWFCEAPLLEKLFIQLTTAPEDSEYNNIDLQEPPGVPFNQLKVIKLSSFKGGNNEMRLVKFLLERAPVLEKMLIVPAPKALLKEDIISNELKSELPLLPKASPQATIVLCEHSSEEDDEALIPTHKELYCEF